MPRLILVLAIVFAVDAHAQARGETITVGVEDFDYMPHFSSEGGVYAGFGAAVLNAFAADVGYRLDYRPMPIARLFKTFVAGDVDLKYPANPLWSADVKADRDVVYSAPVAPYIDGVMVSPTTFGRSADFYVELGTVAGFTAWDWLDRIEAGSVALTENPSLDGLVLQALAGRVEAIYANVAVVRGRLRQLGQPDGLKFDDGLPHTKSAYHLAAIARSDVVFAFDAWLAANPALMDALKAEYRVGEAFLR